MIIINAYCVKNNNNCVSRHQRNVKVTIILSISPESGIISVLPAPLRDLSYVPTAVIQRFMLSEA
jgi:hypothetical protein